MQTQHCEPELVVTLQNQHHAVATLDAQTLKVVGALGGGVLHILEGEAALGHIIGNVEHSQLVGRLPGDGIHSVECEVVAVGVGVVQTGHGTVFVFGAPNELVAQQTLLGGQFLDDTLRGELQSGVALVTGHDHGQEHTILAFDGDHAMGGGGLIEDGVAFVEDFLVLANADTQGTLQNQVEFLTVVGDGVDGLVLKFLIIFISNIVGGSQLPAEHGSHVLDGDAILAGGGQTLALTGDGVTGQLCAVAFQKNGNFNAKSLGALVHKGKGQVNCTGFIQLVGIQRNLGHFCQFLLAEAQNLTHLPNSGSNIHQLGGSVLIGHSDPSFLQKKPVSRTYLRRA